MGQNILLKMDHKVILYFSLFIKYFKPITNKVVMTWKSKGLSSEIIKPPATSDNSLNARLDYFDNAKFRVEFNGSSLKTSLQKFHKRINLHKIYELKSWSYYTDNGFMLGNSLFGGVKLT